MSISGGTLAGSVALRPTITQAGATTGTWSATEVTNPNGLVVIRWTWTAIPGTNANCVISARPPTLGRRYLQRRRHGDRRQRRDSGGRHVVLHRRRRPPPVFGAVSPAAYSITATASPVDHRRRHRRATATGINVDGRWRRGRRQRSDGARDHGHPGGPLAARCAPGHRHRHERGRQRRARPGASPVAHGGSAASAATRLGPSRHGSGLHLVPHRRDDATAMPSRSSPVSNMASRHNVDVGGGTDGHRHEDVVRR